ncbi:energy-coupling factor transporter ATPase [Proteinivorax hydrogeniformans]|uniref:Energy-coupling factor transporter ATP-binding protein EcfA2 n=1 Tax=Proteinivorax hydrogeniformans TaxID=1826727 RepID=A0AAU8HU51_9FIRM
MSIEIKNLSHIYSPNTPFEVKALDNVNTTISHGEFLGVIGHTGSGKSTLIQHLNGLLKPTRGTITVDGLDLTSSNTKLREVRKKVGLVFQYPEHQLFEENVSLDVAFGPKNLGVTEAEAIERAKKALHWVNLDYEQVKNRSPFELSGGQMRRVALAGVLAMEPKYLILDEPTAGLDPKGREEILGKVKQLHKELNLTIILVSHSMDEIGKLVDRIIVMDKSKIFIDDTPKQVFAKRKELINLGLGVPEVTNLAVKLHQKGIDIDPSIYTTKDIKKELRKLLGGA